MREKMVLQALEQSVPVTWEHNKEFLYIYQNAVLLALKERSLLTERQYRDAERRLRMQQKEDNAG